MPNRLLHLCPLCVLTLRHSRAAIHSASAPEHLLQTNQYVCTPALLHRSHPLSHPSYPPAPPPSFVLRLEDAATRRHAFVGISFAERATAFDFNVAITDHERQRQRAAEMQKIAQAADPLAAAQASDVMPEAAALYRHAGDLSLKEGETIK